MNIWIIYRIIYTLINFFFFIFFSIICSQFSENDRLRVYFIRPVNYFLSNILDFLIKDKIKIVNPDYTITKEKINLINSNHIYQMDYFLLLYIFKLNKLDIWQYSSISLDNNQLNHIDKSVLSMINACFIDKDYIKNIRNSVKLWFNNLYKRYIIVFFEGISKIDRDKFDTKYKHVGSPQYQALYNLILYLPLTVKNLTDINSVYTENNRILTCSNKELILKLIKDKNIKIYLEINTYNLPKKENVEVWLDQLYEKKDMQIGGIIDKYNIII